MATIIFCFQHECTGSLPKSRLTNNKWATQINSTSSSPTRSWSRFISLHLKQAHCQAYEKSLGFPANYPRNSIINSKITHRTKRRSSFRNVGFKFAEAAINMAGRLRQKISLPKIPPWHPNRNWFFYPQLINKSSKVTKLDILKGDAEVTINSKRNNDTITIYTDGSAKEGIYNVAVPQLSPRGLLRIRPLLLQSNKKVRQLLVHSKLNWWHYN